MLERNGDKEDRVEVRGCPEEPQVRRLASIYAPQTGGLARAQRACPTSPSVSKGNELSRFFALTIQSAEHFSSPRHPQIICSPSLALFLYLVTNPSTSPPSSCTARPTRHGNLAEACFLSRSLASTCQGYLTNSWLISFPAMVPHLPTIHAALQSTWLTSLRASRHFAINTVWLTRMGAASRWKMRSRASYLSA